MCLYLRVCYAPTEGYSGVVEPSECIHISEKAKVIAKVTISVLYCKLVNLTLSLSSFVHHV